jgi:hypothetical protein
MKVNIAKLLLGRLAVEYYQLHQAGADPASVSDEQEKLVQKLISELKNLGWSSIQDFYDSNERACYSEHVRCFKIVWEEWCDECLGRKRGCYPTCRKIEIDIWGKEWNGLESNFTFKRKKGLSADLDLLTLAEARSLCDLRFVWRNFPNNKAPNCSIKYDKVDEPRFDIYWGMGKGVDPMQYEKDKLSWQGK